MVEVWFPYGQTEVFATIPDERLLKIVKPDFKTIPIRGEEVIADMFEPRGESSLDELLKNKESVAIVMGGDFESGDLIEVYSTLISKIKNSGVREGDIHLLIPSDVNDYSVQPLISGLKPQNVNVIHHDPNVNLVEIGGSSKETKMRINRFFADADLRIAVGVVTPHLLFGYQGAPFKVVPGLTDKKTMKKIFYDSWNLNSRGQAKNAFNSFMENFDRVNVDFSVNIIPDLKGGVLDITSGPPWKSFLEATEKYDKRYMIPIEKTPDILIGSVGGAPFDDHLFGICQGIHTAQKILKEGGKLILAGEWGKWHSSREVLTRLSKFRGGKKSVETPTFDPTSFMGEILLRMLEGRDVTLVSTIPQYYSKKILKLRVARTLNTALKNIKFRIRDRDKMMAVTDLYHIVPSLNPNSPGNSP